MSKFKVIMQCKPAMALQVIKMSYLKCFAECLNPYEEIIRSGSEGCQSEVMEVGFMK